MFSGVVLVIRVDLRIVRAVKVLKDAEFTTIESCEGGEGHAYPEPTIKFAGSRATGWRALGELLTFGLPLNHIGQMWSMTDGHPKGPNWIVTFSKKL